MPVLYDWVSGGGADDNDNATDTSRSSAPSARRSGRCFFRSTTGNYRSLRKDIFRTEMRDVRGHAYGAGCSYLDYAYLTESFAALDFNDRRSTERRTVFTDSVRWQSFATESPPLDSLGPWQMLFSQSTQTNVMYRPLGFSLIFLAQVHFQPWVYEELNQVLLNVLCNRKEEGLAT
jgi:hypothetical protein